MILFEKNSLKCGPTHNLNAELQNAEGQNVELPSFG
jgi:hypothetical protein